MAETGFASPGLSPSRPYIAEWFTARLDGSADYFLRTGLTIDEFAGDWTVAGWFNQDAAAAEQLFEVSDGTALENIGVAVTAGGAISFYQTDTGGAGSYTITTAITGLAAGEWHHVAVTRTTNLFEVWVNGVLDANTVSTASRPASMTQVNIGADVTPAFYFTGYLSQWMVFERAMLTAEIQKMSGQTYGVDNQKVEGRLNWRINFDIITYQHVTPSLAGRWPTTSYGAPPEHQFFTIDWLGGHPSGDLAYTSLIVDNGNFGLTGGATWLLNNSASIADDNLILERGYYGFAETTLPPFTSLIDATSGGDWGFGDPDPTGGVGAFDRDTGFGSPFSFLYSDTVQLLAPLGQFGDDGGYVVEVLADWPIAGPYRFRFRDAGSNYYPATTYCYSGVPTQGFNCYSLTAGVDVIRFASPPAPPGAYVLLIQWGPGWGTEVEVDVDGPTVVTRNRGLDIYALRRRLPAHYKGGPRVARQDPLLP